MLVALGFIGVNVLLVGIASFLEGPVSRQLDAFRLGAALRVGGLLTAGIALLAGGDPRLPDLEPALAGLGIGLVLGVGSAFYCLALSRMASWLAASVANGYIAVTILLGVVVLGERLTWLTAAGLGLTLAGIVALSWRGSPNGDGSAHGRHHTLAVWPIIPYIVLVGIGAFLEKPVLDHLTALQLNLLNALGMAIVAVVAVAVRDRQLPTGSPALAGAGIGVLLSLGSIAYYLGLDRLPVSVAATLSNTSVLVTVALAVAFGHQALTLRQGIGAAITLAGVSVLAMP